MSIHFINRLKTIMSERKITQSELSKRTGIRQSSISDWLNGRYEPKQDKIYLIAQALGVSPSWLLGYDETTSNQTEGYYVYLRTRPGARMLFSAAKDITKEEMEETVKYIEFLKSKHK